MTNILEQTSFDEVTKKNIKNWLEGNYSKNTKIDIEKLLKNNPQEALDAFYTKLSFGTGGLRGVMGVGTNRINKYTIRGATQGFANYLNSHPKKEGRHRIIIGYDTRHHSRYFAEESAKVLAANNIEVLLFDEFFPTPLVSFGCRVQKCSGAIMITASHNPPEYNGFKVYWNHGGQVLFPNDQGIINEVNAIEDLSLIEVTNSIDDANITMVGQEITDAYYRAIYSLQHYPEVNRQKGGLINIIYSNLHGTGVKMVPEALRSWGFTNTTLVEEQREPNGDFPAAKYPNPEDPTSLEIGTKLLLERNADIFLATDPDADRVGVVINHEGKPHLLTGNQVACLCLEHICSSLKDNNKLPENAAFVKTVVTSELFREIATFYNTACFDVLTGFKYIAQLIHKWENEESPYKFLFGGEESYGYLLGTEARDKDGVVSCALIAEIALHCKLQQKTVVDMLKDIYKKYGVFHECVKSLKFPETKEGHEQMENGMLKLFKNPPKTICGKEIVSISDYTQSQIHHLPSKEVTPIHLPKTPLISFKLCDESVIHVRPSGTEPKIKIYCGVKKKRGVVSVEDAIIVCERHAENLIRELVTYIETAGKNRS